MTRVYAFSLFQGLLSLETFFSLVTPCEIYRMTPVKKYVNGSRGLRSSWLDAILETSWIQITHAGSCGT